MERTSAYGGLDRFRIIAAILIVGIHTYPLLLFGEGINFMFVHVFARIAVPFFLMVTGYFLLPRYLVANGSDTRPLTNFVRKTGLLYLSATLMYLPISIYAGHFSVDNLPATIVRMLIFDGTFYHLWYLPASILGVVLVYVLGRKYSFPTIFCIAVGLYFIGLLGDSYHGLVAGIPLIGSAFEAGFSLSSYTRNGLLYAPVFLTLGAGIAMTKKHMCIKASTAGFAVFMAIMLIEGAVLSHFGIQRHTSMYMALVPCMFFLFHILLAGKGQSSPLLRQVSMWIFISHPMFIILVRGAARFLGLTALLVENSLVHFIAVAALSTAFSILTTKAWFHNKKKPPGFRTGRAWVELNMNNLRHNVKVLQANLPYECQLMPAVKANAYGHGAAEISKELNACGISAFCVATVQEGVELRKNGIKGEILILGYTHPEHFHLLSKYDLTQTVIDAGYAQLLDRHGKKLQVHIAVDTGMRRLGEYADNIQDIIMIFGCKNLIISGIFTHQCTVDGCKPSDVDFAQKQIDVFYAVLEGIKEHGYKLPRAHLQSSYGIFRHPELSLDYARVGIALYGMLSTQEDTEKYRTSLRPVLSLKARVSAVKTLSNGESAGYGLAYTAKGPAKIASLSIGYADGVPRGLSCGVGYVLINGKKAPIAGRVCMDQMMVDITGIDDVQQGDVATIIGTDGEFAISACEIAQQTGTIANEILSRLGRRLETYVSN